jgi:hypothetical protein
LALDIRFFSFIFIHFVALFERGGPFLDTHNSSN